MRLVILETISSIKYWKYGNRIGLFQKNAKQNKKNTNRVKYSLKNKINKCKKMFKI